MNLQTVKRCSVAVVLAIAATLPAFQHLHTSAEGLRLIADYEGCRLSPYRCDADKWTDGIGNTCGSTMVKLLNQERWREACLQLPRWVYVKGVFSQGLDNRRGREMAWCLQGAQ